MPGETDLETADNSGETGIDNQGGETEPTTVTTGTGETSSGQASEATPTGELFKGVDPNTLPPEAKAYYDSFLKDYRDKTARLSDTVKSEVAKATESLKSKADFYDQMSSQEEFVKQWNDYVQKAQQAQSLTGEPQNPQLEKMQQEVQQLTQQMKIAEMAKVTDAFADATNEKGEKLHPDFDRYNSILMGSYSEPGRDPEEYSLLRACIELSASQDPSERLTKGYQKAKEIYTQIFEEGRKAGMGRTKDKVQSWSQPPSPSGGSSPVTMTDKKPKSAREALEMARRGQAVSR